MGTDPEASVSGSVARHGNDPVLTARLAMLIPKDSKPAPEQHRISPTKIKTELAACPDVVQAHRRVSKPAQEGQKWSGRVGVRPDGKAGT